MEEKVLISSERCSFRLFPIILTILFLVSLIIPWSLTAAGLYRRWSALRNEYIELYNDHDPYAKDLDCSYCFNYANKDKPYAYLDCPYHRYVVAVDYPHSAEACADYLAGSTIIEYYSAFSGGIRYWNYISSRFPWYNWLFIPFGIFLLVAIIFYLAVRKTKMVVTNHRVYGIVAFGKRVDIPVDSISAIAVIPLLKGVAVASSSGKINFLLTKNATEISNVINGLMIERQNDVRNATQFHQVAQQSDADELKKYKNLLDDGIISQEEFDSKKKQLLGL